MKICSKGSNHSPVLETTHKALKIRWGTQKVHRALSSFSLHLWSHRLWIWSTNFSHRSLSDQSWVPSARLVCKKSCVSESHRSSLCWLGSFSACCFGWFERPLCRPASMMNCLKYLSRTWRTSFLAGTISSRFWTLMSVAFIKISRLRRASSHFRRSSSTSTCAKCNTRSK